MNVSEAISVALVGLWGNKLRSFLTMLGVIIGVSAVIIVVAIGLGLKHDTLQRIERMGTNLLMVIPGPAREAGVTQDITVVNLQAEDADAIQQEVSGVAAIEPEVEGRVQVKYRAQNTRTRIIGTNLSYPAVRNWKVARGRFFSEAEYHGRQRVCILGSDVYDALFQGKPAVGQWVRVHGLPFKVIGVAAEIGGSFGHPDDQIVAPLTTVKTRVLGLDHITGIGVSAASSELVDRVEQGIDRVLRQRHHIHTGAPNDFRVMKQAMFLASMSQAAETMTKLLGGIALVSLLVGGVGIMNIMLVSVTERTREIGVRKAVGARKADIMSQFLIESVVISVVGGLIGVTTGVAVSKVLASQSGWTTIISPTSIIEAFLFAAAVGVFFGLWPAYKAAGLDPIVALRHE